MNLKQTIRKVLREEKYHLPIKRRINLIDEELFRVLERIYTPDKICIYRSGEELIMVITEAIVENLYFHTFYNMDDESIEWRHIHDFIVGYVQKKYGKKLEEYFHLNCGN